GHDHDVVHISSIRGENPARGLVHDRLDVQKNQLHVALPVSHGRLQTERHLETAVELVADLERDVLTKGGSQWYLEKCVGAIQRAEEDKLSCLASQFRDVGHDRV